MTMDYNLPCMPGSQNPFDDSFLANSDMSNRSALNYWSFESEENHSVDSPGMSIPVDSFVPSVTSDFQMLSDSVPESKMITIKKKRGKKRKGTKSKKEESEGYEWEWNSSKNWIYCLVKQSLPLCDQRKKKNKVENKLNLKVTTSKDNPCIKIKVRSSEWTFLDKEFVGIILKQFASSKDEKMKHAIVFKSVDSRNHDSVIVFEMGIPSKKTANITFLVWLIYMGADCKVLFKPLALDKSEAPEAFTLQLNKNSKERTKEGPTRTEHPLAQEYEFQVEEKFFLREALIKKMEAM